VYRVEYSVPKDGRRIPNSDFPGQWTVERLESLPVRYHRASKYVLDYDPADAKPFDADLAPMNNPEFLTVKAVEPVRAIHDRMPLILPSEWWDAWLDPAATVAELLTLLTPAPAGLLDVVRVRPAVNKAGTEGPECLTPAA
jgi:hypothetical protein